MSPNTPADKPQLHAAPPKPVLEGDALLNELRQGWVGLPNKTLLSLAMGGLRVRMMRSTVTMLSIVLAIAFLTYTGLSGTINYRLVRVAEDLSDRGTASPAVITQVSQAVQRVSQADLVGNLDTSSLKAEARLAGFDRISNELTMLPIAQRTLSRLQDEATQKEVNYNTARSSSQTLPAELNQARSQRDTAIKELAIAQAEVDTLVAKVDMGKWVRSGELPADTTDAQMETQARTLLSQLYQELLQNINAPARLSNESLLRLGRPLTLAGQAGMDEDVAVLRQAVERIWAQRQSESLLNMLRRSGVNIEKTREGNPMDVWLIVMALMTCAVGIANAMLMSVTERFREIGTMKCLGAQDSLVVKLFLLESAFLGVVGAAGGIIIGVVVSLLASVLQFGSFGVNYFPIVGALPTIFWSVLGGVILSVVGAVYPAFAASRMKPVDALRVDE